MPGGKHVAAWSAKENRMYEHIKEGQGGSSRAKEIAARTVNKYRSKHGLTKEDRKKSFADFFNEGQVDDSEEIALLIEESIKEIDEEAKVNKGERMGGPYSPAGKKPEPTKPAPHDAEGGHAVEGNKGSNQRAGGFAEHWRPGKPTLKRPTGEGKDEPKQNKKVLGDSAKKGTPSYTAGRAGSETAGNNSQKRGPGPTVGSSRPGSGPAVDRNPHQSKKVLGKGLDWIKTDKSSLIDMAVAETDKALSKKIEGNDLAKDALAREQLAQDMANGFPEAGIRNYPLLKEENERKREFLENAE